MKFLPPIIALLVVAAWLGTRRHSIRSIGKQVASLEHRIHAARNADAPPADESLASRVRRQHDTSLNGSRPIDWKQIAAGIAANPGSRPDMRTFAGLQQRAMDMSADELTDALDEIDTLELPKNIRDQLESMLVSQLARKAPRQTLERYAERIKDDRDPVKWHLTEAISRWADEDPAAAGDWLDRRIDAGLFDSTSLDGRNQDRIRFEAAMIGSLLSDNPASAANRLALLPESQRAEILRQHWLLKLEPGEHAAFATLARSTLAPGEPANALAQTAASLGGGSDGYQRVSDFITRIDATPDEQQAIIGRIAQDKLGQACRNPTIDRAAFDEMRGWLASQSPATADAVTGETLGKLTGSSIKPPHSFALAAELHDETGNDELLVGFLANGNLQKNPELARPLVEKISDPATRETLLSELEQSANPPQSTERPTP